MFCPTPTLAYFLDVRYIVYISTLLSQVREEHSEELNSIKEEYRKEINKLKRQIHDHIALSRHKQAERHDNTTTLKSVWEQLKGLEDDKREYVEKNLKQAKLLDEFMSQIADLQNELSNIIATQTDMDAKLKDRERQIVVERKRRHDTEMKYKMLLKGNHLTTNTTSTSNGCSSKNNSARSTPRPPTTPHEQRRVSGSSVYSCSSSANASRRTPCEESWIV